jgi:CRP-like cAMP-binding protein
METSEVIRRVPIFQGLSEIQVDRMLGACHVVNLNDGETAFSEGDESNSMLILLLGQLEVRSQTGVVLASIDQNGVVGEMGVLTGERRSATVVALGVCTVLVISRTDLNTLIDEDKDIGFQIYRNVTRILIDRLRDNNILLEQQYLLLEDLAGGPGDSEQ